MEQVIYGDVLFLINFSMDFLTLYITAGILRISCRLLPMILSSSVGAVYAVAAVFFAADKITDIIICLAVSALISYIAFGWSGKRAFIRDTVTFIAVSMLLGGVMTVIFNFLNRSTGMTYSPDIFITDDSIYSVYSSVPLYFIVLSAFIAAVFTAAAAILSRKRVTAGSVTVETEYRGKELRFEALLDSGNLLTDPLSGKPVVILSPNLFDSLTGGKEKLMEGGMKARLRFIPAASISGDCVLMGIVPDHTVIDAKEKEVVLARGKEDAVDYGGFMAIVGEI